MGETASQLGCLLCIYGNVNRPALGLDFFVRAKRARCTCRFPILFPSTNCLANRSDHSQSFVVTRESPSCGLVALNNESVGSSMFEFPAPIVNPLIIELSDSEGDPPKFGDVNDADFATFL